MKGFGRLAIGTAGLIGASALFSWAAGAQARRLVPAIGEFVEIDGTRLHYVDTGGDGAPIVLIHGLGGQLQNFGYALADLLTDRFRVVMVDRPGSGYSDARAGATPSLFDQARLIAGLIRRLGLERPLVVGHSLGGAVALALAADDGEAIGGLALIAPLSAPKGDVPVAFRGLLIASRRMRLLVAHTIAVPGMMLLSAHRRNIVFAPDAMPSDFEVLGGGVLLRRGAVLAAASSDIVDANDALASLGLRYADIAMPVDVLFGRDDRVLDVAGNGEALVACIPGARLTLCDGGHMLPVTQPALVADWLDAVQTRLERTL